MQIEYEISEQDFLDAQKLAMKNHPSRSSRFFFRILPFWGVFLCIAIVWPALKQWHSWNQLPILLLGLVLLSMPLLMKLAQRRAYRRAASIHGRLTMAVGESGLSFSGSTFSSHLEWNFFPRFVEDDKVFVLWQGNRTFNVIPKRQLAPEQISELRAAFTRNIGAKKLAAT
jgi:YcxB-like protein